MISNDEVHILDAVRQTQQGDTRAFEVVLSRFKSPAFTIALRIVKSREDAEEVAQDSFIKAYKNLSSFKGDSKFSTWFFKIVYNTALTKIRKKKILVNELDEQMNQIEDRGQMDGWKQLQVTDQKRYIRLALESLSRDDSLVITLFYLSENSLPEICEITGWKHSAAKVKLHRARKKLEVALFGLLDEEIKTLL